MQRNIFIIALLFAFQTQAQEYEFETNDEGHAYYSSVEEVSGLSNTDLFDRGLEWINEYYVNPTGVIKVKDKEKMIIEGKARLRLMTYDKKGNEVVGGGIVSYQIHLFFKDGRYKYEFERIRWEKPSYYDVTRWNDKSQVGYNEANFNFYKKQVIEYIDETIESLTQYMKVGKEEKSSDW